MPKMAYASGPENVKVLAAIEKLLEDLIEEKINLQDVNERIQQHLGQINNSNNLEPGERLVE